MSEQNILEVRNLTKHFKAGRRQVVHAVDDVSLTLKKGRTLGLVGESGCGKSSCARTIIRMYDPTSGQIILDGDDITNLSQKQLKPYRKKMQILRCCRSSFRSWMKSCIVMTGMDGARKIVSCRNASPV